MVWGGEFMAAGGEEDRACRLAREPQGKFHLASATRLVILSIFPCVPLFPG